MGGWSSPGITKPGISRPLLLLTMSCFPALLAPNRGREIGGGRATRQPGQVRKEAALTRSGSGRSSVSYLFFRANRAGSGIAASCAGSAPFRKPAERQSIADRPMTDAGAPSDQPDSADQGGFDLGGPPEAGKPYRVLARKYRPSSFDDLIGQEAMVRTVSNAFETGRIPQAWILTGVRGVGKTTTARILARALNYELPDGSVKGPTSTCRSSACIARRSWKAGTWTCWRWTPPRTPASTMSARSMTACAMRRPAPATRSTSSTKSTCCRRRRSTPS